MPAQLLDVFGFLSVLLRGGALSLNSLVLGGILYCIFVLRPMAGSSGEEPAWDGCRRLIAWSATALIATQLCLAAVDSAILGGTAGLSLRDLAGANYFVASLAVVCAGTVIAYLTRTPQWRPGAGLLAPAAIALGALVSMSHAAARLDHRAALYVATGIHQAATATWVGGLPYLLVTLARWQDPAAGQSICRRFSVLAMIGVGLLAGSGVGMSMAYVGSVPAVYGTAYGAMVACKVLLFGVLLCLGYVNMRIVRRLPAVPAGLVAHLRRFAEAEVGIGFTVILAAASLTSQPPAVDLPTGRLTAAEIGQRMRPSWPLLETPPLSALSPPTPLEFGDTSGTPAGALSFVPGASYHPSTPGDIAWSEYNHHWAGLIVLAIGLLALLARSGVPWARHWPLAFLALAVFLFLRSDPENWPLGSRSFWQSFSSAEVLQHRVFVVLIVMFAVFEWGIRTGRIASTRAGLVFPMVCAAGGALLLTHAHALGNIKEELLAELSHIPLAIFAVLAGWSRWLEVRLPSPRVRILAWIWPLCFVMIGSVLINYREG